MELRQLTYVVAVADEGSFTRAAAREHVAQPGVSAQVRRLEAELGQALFARGPGPVTPTAAGEAVLPLARAALPRAAGGRGAPGAGTRPRRACGAPSTRSPACSAGAWRSASSRPSGIASPASSRASTPSTRAW